MLSIQAVCGLPRLGAPGIVLCIISSSRQLPSFLMVWPWCANFLALAVSNGSLLTPSLLRTQSFVFFAVHETRKIFLSLLSQRRQDVFLTFFWVSSFHSCTQYLLTYLLSTLLQATLVLLVIFALKSVRCDFSTFSAVMLRSPAPVWPGTEFRCTLTIFCNQGPMVRERTHLLQFFILN